MSEEYRPAEAVKETEKTHLFYRTDRLVAYCMQTIEKYSLNVLLKEPQKVVFEKMLDDEKEKLCMGMLKLGEALTYCRDSSEDRVQNTGICELAINYVSVRNHFTHHHVYQDNLQRYRVLNNKIWSIGSIESLRHALTRLEKCGVDTLSKETAKGPGNPFKFEYLHFLRCLKSESMLLSKTLLDLKGVEKIPFEKKVLLENKIRNILTIMVDLLDEERKNTNNGDICDTDKKNVGKLNEKFALQELKYEKFFKMLRYDRNALCHLQSDSPKPYTDNDDESLLNFAGVIDDLLQKGYVKDLESELSPKKAEAPRVEILSIIEPSKKPPKKVKPPVAVVAAKKPTINPLGLLKKAYTTGEAAVDKPVEQNPRYAEQNLHEPQKKKEKKGSPGSSPRIGGMK